MSTNQRYSPKQTSRIPVILSPEARINLKNELLARCEDSRQLLAERVLAAKARRDNAAPSEFTYSQIASTLGQIDRMLSLTQKRGGLLSLPNVQIFEEILNHPIVTDENRERTASYLLECEQYAKACAAEILAIAPNSDSAQDQGFGRSCHKLTGRIVHMQNEIAAGKVPSASFKGDIHHIVAGLATAMRPPDPVIAQLHRAFRTFLKALAVIGRAKIQAEKTGEDFYVGEYMDKIERHLGYEDKVHTPGTYRALYVLLLQYLNLKTNRPSAPETLDATMLVSRWSAFEPLRFYPPGINLAFGQFLPPDTFGADFPNYVHNGYQPKPNETLRSLILSHYGAHRDFDDVVAGLVEANRWTVSPILDSPLVGQGVKELRLSAPLSQQRRSLEAAFARAQDREHHRAINDAKRRASNAHINKRPMPRSPN